METATVWCSFPERQEPSGWDSFPGDGDHVEMWQYKTFDFILILALMRPWILTRDEVMGSTRCFEEQGLHSDHYYF